MTRSTKSGVGGRNGEWQSDFVDLVKLNVTLDGQTGFSPFQISSLRISCPPRLELNIDKNEGVWHFMINRNISSRTYGRHSLSLHTIWGRELNRSPPHLESHMTACSLIANNYRALLSSDNKLDFYWRGSSDHLKYWTLTNQNNEILIIISPYFVKSKCWNLSVILQFYRK